MKKLLIALMLASGFATAAEYYTTPTEAGGRIVLTFDKSDWCEKNLYIAYVEMTDQNVLYGCWAIINEKIHVRYNDNQRRVYDPTGFVKQGKP
jgi:hypothetical protein